MAPSQPQSTSSPHPAHTAGPSTASSSTTSPTGTHSTVATTVGNRQRSWDEDKHLHLYILDYCRRRKFDETASAFEREARISPDAKINFDAPQGLLFEWWVVFWETFNSQRSHLAGPPGQGESSQAYVNTMGRLRKLAMHEKDEQNRARSMSVNMSAPVMSNPMMGGMPPVMNGSASAMSTPAMANMPNPMGGPRPQSQASARMPQQPGMGQPGQQPMASHPGMPQQQGLNMGQMNGPGPQQPGPPQPGMGQQQRPQQPGMGMPQSGMHMTPNMTHASTPHASTPSAPHVSSTPSPVPTPPQTFPGGPGPQQPQFNPQFNPSQPQFSAPGGPGQPFPGQPGQFSGAPGNQQPFRPGPGQNGPPGQNAPFPPNASGPGFQPNAGGPGQNFPGQPGFQPGPGNGPGPQQPFQGAPGGQQFPGGPGPGPGGPGAFPPGVRQGPGMPYQNNNQPPEWGQRPPPPGGPGGPDQGRRPDGSWEDGRPRPGMMGQQPKMAVSHPGMQQYLGRPGPHPQHMMVQPGMGGQPMGGPAPSPKDDNRSVTPQQTQAGWDGGIGMQRRPGMAAQGGQMGPGRPGFNPGAQKRPGSPPPSAAANNLGGSPPDPKRPRPNDPGPGVLVDSRVGPDGRPTSSKGGAPFPGQGMNGQANPQTQQRLNEQQYSQELRGATAEMRGAVLRQGGPQPAPFGKGQQANGNAGRGSRPPDAPSPSGGEGPGQPRQVANIKGQASNQMGPPASPGMAHRNVGGVKKSDSAGNSPALPPSTVPNGMNQDRSHTPQQIKQGDHSPMPAPMTRPQSAQPSMNQGPSFAPISAPPPPGSAPPMLPNHSPSNGMLAFDSKLAEPFDFGAGMGLGDFPSDLFSGMDPAMFPLGEWGDNE